MSTIAQSKAKCPACKAPIARIVVQPSKLKHAVDKEPQPDGEIALIFEGGQFGKPEGVQLSRASRLTYEGPLYRSHVKSCTAPEWKRKQTRAS